MSNGTLLHAKDREKVTFPQEGWSYYPSKKEALKAEMAAKSVEPSEPQIPALTTAAEKISARQEALRQRETLKMLRLEKTKPGLAERVRKESEMRLEQRLKREADKLARVQSRLHPRSSTLPLVSKWFEWPANPERFQTVTTPDGKTWVFDQPRDPDGTFTSDDLSTLKIESAMRWIPVPSTP
jgi:hypothetical protein